MAIEINGKKYKVIENLGFVHDRGEYAKAVMTNNGERIEVKSLYGGSWRFAKPLMAPGRNARGQ